MEEFEPEHTVIEESDSTGIEWPDAEGFRFGDETVESVVYNRGLGRLLVNVEAPESPDGFDQYVFSASDEDSVVTVVGDSAVGVPPLDENPGHYLWELLNRLQDVEVR